MRSLNFTILIITALLFAACKKSTDSTPVLDGAYSGQFNLVKTASGGATPLAGNIQLTLKSTSFNSQNTGYLTAGYGKFTTDNNQLNFTDSAVINGTEDTPGVVPDYGACLFGPYNLQVKGDSLILTKTTAVNTYTYRLKKQ